MLGCTNHGCVFRDNQGGLGTNAICQCVTNLIRDGGTKGRIELEIFLRDRKKEIERLRRVEEAAREYHDYEAGSLQSRYDPEQAYKLRMRLKAALDNG